MESWKEFLEGLELKRRQHDLTKGGEKMIICINNLILPNKLDYENFLINLVIVDELPYCYQTTEKASTSVRTLVKNFEIIPQGYDNFFIAAFPDTYLWVQNNFETDKELVSLFDQFEIYRDIYLDERKKFSVSFYKKLCDLYLQKGNRFELSK